MSRSAFVSLRGHLLLFGAAWFTLFNKVRRDGFSEFAKTFVQVCFAEQPFIAIARHREVVAFFKQPSMAALDEMPIANKYLSGYLAKGLDKRARRDVLLHHYRSIAERAAPDFLTQVLTGSYVLWKGDADNSYAIKLTFNSLTHYEGDLSAVFVKGDQRIFEISFALVPGAAIGSSTAELLFIGRVQGAKHQLVEIKRATAACGDVAPQHMLMVAIQSIAQALGIAAVAGVTNDGLVATDPNNYYNFDYNAFWKNWAEYPTKSHFYEMSIPLRRTPLNEIQASHRRRTRRRREFKEQVAMQIAANLRAVFGDQAIVGRSGFSLSSLGDVNQS